MSAAEREREQAAREQQLRSEWAAREGVRQSCAHTDIIPWLLGRRAPAYGEWPGWFDHGTRWVKNGRPFCLVGQPYQLSSGDLAELARLESEHHLCVYVCTSPAWHFPGEVLFVEVRRS